MIRAIVDTDILSEILSARDPRVIQNASNYVAEHNVITFTSVTLYEIVTGLEKSQAAAKLNRTRQMLAQNEEIVPDSEDYYLAGKILGTLRRLGREVGYSDPLIGGCAIRRDLSVVTGNQRHFQYVRDAGFGVTLENWRDELSQ